MRKVNNFIKWSVLNAYDKGISIIESCTNTEQLRAADKYNELFNKVYSIPPYDSKYLLYFYRSLKSKYKLKQRSLLNSK